MSEQTLRRVGQILACLFSALLVGGSGYVLGPLLNIVPAYAVFGFIWLAGLAIMIALSSRKQRAGKKK